MFSYFVKRTNDFIFGTINYRGNQLRPTRRQQTNKWSPAPEGDRLKCHLHVNQWKCRISMQIYIKLIIIYQIYKEMRKDGPDGHTGFWLPWAKYGEIETDETFSIFSGYNAPTLCNLATQIEMAPLFTTWGHAKQLGWFEPWEFSPVPNHFIEKTDNSVVLFLFFFVLPLTIILRSLNTKICHTKSIQLLTSMIKL